MRAIAKPGIDVVIVTYNSAGYLPRLAGAVRQCSAVSSVTVVDNQSGDESADIARALDWGSPTNVIVRDSNPGFGASMNLGAFNTPEQHDQILILNPDVAISSESLNRMSETLRRNERLAVVGPTLVTSDGTAVSSARDFPTTTSIAMRQFANVDHQGEFASADWLCGASMLWKRAVFESLGGFSEEFFLYFEDVDICKRARTAGWEVAIDGSLTAIHDQGHGRTTSKYLRSQSRESRRKYSRKWFGFRGVLAARFADVCDQLADLYHQKRSAL